MNGTKLTIAGVAGGVPAILLGAMGANLLVDLSIGALLGCVAWEFSPELQRRFPRPAMGRIPVLSRVDWKGVFAGQNEAEESSEVDDGETIEYLRSLSYPEYLKTRHWQKTRKEARERANHHCQVCRASNVQLDTHHNTYERIGQEEPDDLIVLCHECHGLYELRGKLPKRAVNLVEEEDETIEEETLFDETDDEIEQLSFGDRKITVFSQILKTGWRPSLSQIYVGTDTKGKHVFVPANKLCHVALAGATGHGKSSLMRLIMAQLCYLKLPVALLNPHYMIYDRDHDEHWTPYTPYLWKDPMECREMRNIEIALRWMADELLPKRKARCSRGESAGAPFFFILDEYPDIKAEIGDAPELIGKILRQGRKYNIFLIVASQDFSVKTLGVEGEGAVRKCFLTTFYVGGDPITAKELLNKKASDIPENDLGQGTIMLKCATIEDPITAHVPYLDNESLYTLLGPTTFVRAEQEVHTDELDILPSSSPLQTPENGENQSENPSSSSSLPDGWTEEDVLVARRLAETVKDRERIIELLGKKGTRARLRDELNQVLGQGEIAG